MAAEGFREDAMRLTRFADMRYVGQAYELTVPAPATVDVEELVRLFAAEHRLTYGHASSDPVQVVSVRIVARDGHDASSLAGLRAGAVSGGTNGLTSERDAFFSATGRMPTPVTSRDALEGRELSGPLIIEEYDATCVVPPGWTVTLDHMRNINLEARRS
jgi:N-methylhydantoinase A